MKSFQVNRKCAMKIYFHIKPCNILFRIYIYYILNIQSSFVLRIYDICMHM